MEGQVPRPRTGPQRDLPVHGGDTVHEGADPHRVGAEVHADGPAPAGVGLYLVGVRPLLPLGVRAGAGVAQDAGGGPGQGAVGADRYGGDGAGAVVGGQHVPGVQAQVGRSVALDGHRTPGGLGPAPAHAVGGHRALGGLADGVEHVPVGSQGQVGGVGQTVRAAHDREGAAVRGDGRRQDPGAAGRRERPDVCPPLPPVTVRHRCPFRPASSGFGPCAGPAGRLFSRSDRPSGSDGSSRTAAV